jgi:hypothetical protein
VSRLFIEIVLHIHRLNLNLHHSGINDSLPLLNNSLSLISSLKLQMRSSMAEFCIQQMKLLYRRFASAAAIEIFLELLLRSNLIRAH